MSETLQRVVVFGTGSVGKTAITTKFCSDYDPTIEDSYRRLVEVEGRHCMIEIMDTAGNEQFNAMRELYIKSGQGFLMIFSITSNSSFYALDPIYDQIIKTKALEEDEDVPAPLSRSRSSSHKDNANRAAQNRKSLKLMPTGQSMSLQDIAEYRKNIDNLNIPMILVGNKSDLDDQREVPRDSAQNLAAKFKCEYIETSAKSGSNIELVFKTLTKLVLEKKGLLTDKPETKKKKAKCIIL